MRNIRERPKLRLHISSEQVDKSAEVAHLVAIIRRAEYGDALASVRNLVPFHLHLVRPDQELKAICIEEALGRIPPPLP